MEESRRYYSLSKNTGGDEGKREGMFLVLPWHPPPEKWTCIFFLHTVSFSCWILVRITLSFIFVCCSALQILCNVRTKDLSDTDRLLCAICSVIPPRIKSLTGDMALWAYPLSISRHSRALFNVLCLFVRKWYLCVVICNNCRRKYTIKPELYSVRIPVNDTHKRRKILLDRLFLCAF